MDQHISQIYAKNLLPSREGYPLWIPEPDEELPPCYRRTGARIGDVGVISHDGGFQFLFNICSAVDDPVNRAGVPPHFERIDIGPTSHKPSYFNPTGAFVQSAELRRKTISVEAGADAALVPAGVGFAVEFSMEGDEGAVLVLPRGGSRRDAKQLMAYETQIQRHGQEWYTYVRNVLGWRIDNGDLYLVTGVDKVSTWGALASRNTQRSRAVSFHFTATPMADAGIRYEYQWRHLTSQSARQGPDARTLMLGDDGTPVENQCVFVRGYKIMIRRRLWRRKQATGLKVVDFTGSRSFGKSASLKTAPSGVPTSAEAEGRDRQAEVTDAYLDSADGSQGLVDEGDIKYGSGSRPDEDESWDAGEEVSYESIPPPAILYHPSDALNSYMIDNTDCSIAFTHDSVWMSTSGDVDILRDLDSQGALAQYELETVGTNAVTLRRRENVVYSAMSTGRCDAPGLYNVRYIPGSDSKKLETLIPNKHTLGHKRIYGTIGFDIGKAQQLRLASEKTLLWVIGTTSVLHFDIYAEHQRSADELLARKSWDLSTISSSGDPFFVEMEVCDPVHGQLPLRYTCTMVLTKTSTRHLDKSVLNRTLQISEKWTSIVDKAQQAVEIGLAVSEVNPIAKAAASLVKLVTDGARRRVECYDAIGETIDVIKGASEMVVEHCDGDKKQTELRDALVPLIKDCGGYLCELSGSSWVKQSSSFAARKLQGMRKALQSNMDAVKQYTASAAQRDVHRLSGDVEKLTRTLQKWAGDIKNEIAGKLYSHLPCNLTIVANSLRGCLTGTRDALLFEIETWAASNGARGFCLYGASGKGKSAVAHSVAIRLGTAGFDTAFFSFDKSDRSRSPLQVFPTLAAQLSRHNLQYKAQLSALADDVLAANGPADQWKNLFLGPFSQQAPPRPVVLVLDALDECPDDPPEQRAAFMKQLDCCLADAFPFDVRFFITARSKYGGSGVHRVSIDELPNDLTKQDILLLVKDQLGPARSAQPIDGACLADGVANAANTSFGHATVLCRELMGTPSTSAPNILALVKQAPGQLYPLYLFLLQSHFDVNRAEDMLSYRHVVTWILLVAMPQRRCVFKQFAAVHRSRINVDLVLERLGSLFIGLDMDEPVQPLHASFRDFVLDAGVSGPYAISIGPDAHMDLADVCLRIMNEPGAGLRFNICQLASSYVLDDIDFLPLVDEHISEGLQYACGAMASHLHLSVVSRSVNVTGGSTPREMQPHRGWMALWGGVVSLYSHHARPSRLPPHVHEGLEVFLKRNFLFWLEACSCMQLGSLPSTALLQLLELLQYLRSDDLQPLVEDYIQFSGRFQDGIAASPPQVYISGLALSPPASVVCDLYSQSFSRLISASGKAIGEHSPDAVGNAHPAAVASTDSAGGIDTQFSQQDGWLLHPHRNPRTPFLWIPSYLRRYLFVTAPSGMAMPDYVVNIDMRDAALGEDWTKIYQPPVDESVPPDHEGQVDAPIVDDTESMPGGFPA